MRAPSRTMTAVVRSSSIEMERAGGADSSLSRSARSLADAARRFRGASDAEHDPQDLALAFALVDGALEDLAAAAELTAYATMEGSRRRRADGTNRLPLARARALSWRLHGLRAGLAGARRICSELTRELDGVKRR